MSGCSALSGNAYLDFGRHNQISKLIHQELAIKYRILGYNTPLYYKYNPPEVLEKPDYVMY